MPMTTGANPRQVTKVVDFLVVDYPSAYNATIGRPTLNKMKAITFTYHLLMPFPIEEGVVEVRGDQTTARECYVASLRGKELREALVIDDMKGRDDVQLKQTEPSKDLEELNINPNCPERVVHVGRALSKEFKFRLQRLLIAYRDAFD